MGKKSISRWHCEVSYGEMSAMNGTDASLQSDKEAVLAAVTQDGCALKYAHASLQSDKEVVLAAVTQYGHALSWAHASLLSDKEVVLAAVTQNGWSLKYAHESLKSDKEFVLAAVTQNGGALVHADASLQTDLEILLVDARHRSATTALKLVRRLKQLPDWEAREAELGRAAELLAAFPDTAPGVNKRLCKLVESMHARAYGPGASGRKRDRDAFKQDFEQGEIH